MHRFRMPAGESVQVLAGSVKSVLTIPLQVRFWHRLLGSRSSSYSAFYFSQVTFRDPDELRPTTLPMFTTLSRALTVIAVTV